MDVEGGTQLVFLFFEVCHTPIRHNHYISPGQMNSVGGVPLQRLPNLSTVIATSDSVSECRVVTSKTTRASGTTVFPLSALFALSAFFAFSALPLEKNRENFLLSPAECPQYVMIQ